MKQNRFFAYFAVKNKLSLRRVSTGEDVWHLFLSRGNLILSVLAFVLVVFIGVLTLVAYTPILDLVPGYPGNRSREMLVASIAKLDSLDREIGLWERYTRDLQLVLDGRSTESSMSANDTAANAVKGSITSRSMLDSLLRGKIQTEQSTSDQERRRTQELTFEMISPISGIVSEKFAPQNRNYGVTVNPRPNSVVLCVMDGTVIMETWTPDEGYIVAVQHAASMMSIYKGLQQSLRPVGARIKAGEGIGISETVSEGHIPTLVFELWNGGNAVDPENYITFD